MPEKGPTANVSLLASVCRVLHTAKLSPCVMWALPLPLAHGKLLQSGSVALCVSTTISWKLGIYALLHSRKKEREYILLVSLIMRPLAP